MAKGKRLYLTAAEQEFVNDLLTWWGESLEDTRQLILEDASLDNPESLLDLMADLDEQERRIDVLRGKLRSGDA